MPATFFGPRWDAPMLDEAIEVPTPVGKPCSFCTEPVDDGDQGVMLGAVTAAPRGEGLQATVEPVHRGCLTQNTIGHVVGVCSCFGWGQTKAAGLEVIARIERTHGV